MVSPCHRLEPTNFALCFTTSFIDQGVYITYDTLRDCPSSEQQIPMYKYTHAYTTNQCWIFCVITSTITAAAATYTAFFFFASLAVCLQDASCCHNSTNVIIFTVSSSTTNCTTFVCILGLLMSFPNLLALMMTAVLLFSSVWVRFRSAFCIS